MLTQGAHGVYLVTPAQWLPSQAFMQVVGDKTEAEKLNNLPEVAPLGVEQTPSCVVMAATWCLSLLHFGVRKFQMRSGVMSLPGQFGKHGRNILILCK